MSRTLKQLTSLAHKVASTQALGLQLSQLQAPPTLLRNQARSWYGPTGQRVARELASSTSPWGRGRR